MQIIIVGDGKVGVALTEQLSSEGHDITVIDSNPKVLEQSLESYDVMVVHGNGASIGVLKEAGVEDAHLLIAATSRDETNLLTCIVAKKLGAKHTIARVRNPEYAEQLVLMRDELGLSMTINPELAAAREIHHLLQFPSFLKRDSFAKGRVEIVEIHVGEDSKLAGIPLNRLYEIARVRVLVCVVERGGTVHIPDGSFTLQAGDNIYVTADSQDLAQLIKHLGIVKQKVRNAIIVGGSRIAYYLAMRCLHAGLGVKIIEQNHERCVELAELLPSAVIIEADGSRQDILAAEGISSTDAVITLTNMDEENLIISMYASHIRGAKSHHKGEPHRICGSLQEHGHRHVHQPQGAVQHGHRALCARHAEHHGRQRYYAAPHGGGQGRGAGIPRIRDHAPPGRDTFGHSA